MLRSLAYELAPQEEDKVPGEEYFATLKDKDYRKSAIKTPEMKMKQSLALAVGVTRKLQEVYQRRHEECGSLKAGKIYPTGMLVLATKDIYVGNTVVVKTGTCGKVQESNETSKKEGTIVVKWQEREDGLQASIRMRPPQIQEAPLIALEEIPSAEADLPRKARLPKAKILAKAATNRMKRKLLLLSIYIGPVLSAEKRIDLRAHLVIFA